MSHKIYGDSVLLSLFNCSNALCEAPYVPLHIVGRYEETVMAYGGHTAYVIDFFSNCLYNPCLNFFRCIPEKKKTMGKNRNTYYPIFKWFVFVPILQQLSARVVLHIWSYLRFICFCNLTFAILWSNSVDDRLMIFFLENSFRYFNAHCFLLRRKFAWIH